MQSSNKHSWSYQDAAAPLSRRIEDHLLAAVRKLSTNLDVDEVCDAVLAGAAAVFAATASWIFLHDPVRNVLRVAKFHGDGAEAFQNVENPAQSNTIAWLTFSNREFMFVPDVTREQRWQHPERVHASGLKSVLSVPLIAADVAVGVVCVDSTELSADRPPSELQIKRLELFAAQAAIGITNARLYEASQQDRARLRTLLRQRRELCEQVTELRQAVNTAYSFGSIVGESTALRRVLAEVEQVATSDVTVLLLGETGTGKELVARAVHESSRRASRPFVPVNCAALPETLVESEMFGHEKGAFTGAHARKPGRFEVAHGGTLFLDEIGDLPLAAQAKLLRVLQDGRVERVGGTQPVVVNVRIVAATNQDLTVRVADKAFREDLFYRLNVFPIHVPPLRERLADIPLLASHFGARFAERAGKRVAEIQQAALDKLQRYHWPGNVRELQNVVERAVILARIGPITADHIRVEEVSRTAVHEPTPPSSSSAADQRDADQLAPLADIERTAILRALKT
nr:sigma 54-interacting transcriptional regulator [Acidobacteriota bacterium]